MQVSTIKYWPFGKVRSGNVSTSRRFTGQRWEQSATSTMDAYFYNARFYSPKTAHFMSADTVVPEVSQRGLNRFSYVYNSPLVFNDPSGLCPPRTDVPCPEPAPVAGGHDVYVQQHCRDYFALCLTYGLWAKYGTSPSGFVIVMGLTNGFDDMGGFEGYSVEFLRRYVPACGGRVSECWSDAKRLMAVAGSDAVYSVFGLSFVVSDPAGMAIGGILYAWAGVTDGGRGGLERVMFDPRGKDLKGVVGYSLGADTVARFYRDFRTDFVHVPFYLDHAYPTEVVKEAATYRNSAGRSDFFDGGDCCGPSGHHPNNGAAAIFDTFELIRAELTVY